MEELEKYRGQIREVNRKILRLLRERLDIVKEIGELKKREGIPLRNIQVENRQIQELQQYGKDLEIDGDFIENIFRQIIAYTVKVEEIMGVQD